MKKLLVTLIISTCLLQNLFAQNVGIGTTTPQSKLEVVGGVKADSIKVNMLSGIGNRMVMADSNGVLIVPNITVFNNTSTISIPENDCSNPAVSTINVQGFNGTINPALLKIKIDITHPWVNDLLIILVAPNNQKICLVAYTGGSGDNFTQTEFSDSAVSYIVSALPPYTGTFKPQGTLNLAGYCGFSCDVTTFGALGAGTLNPNGSWKLYVYDAFTPDVGTINSFSISFGSPTLNNGNNIDNALAVWQNNTLVSGNVSQTDKGLEFGKGQTKEINAGKISYQKFSDGLDIVGAGTTSTNRKITFFNEGGANFTGKINGAAGADIIGQASVDSLLVQANGSSAINNAIKVVKSAVNATLDQYNYLSSTTSVSSTSTAARWQSFTAGFSANLGYLRLNFDSAANRTVTLKIYAGEGTTGTQLFTTDISINSSSRFYNIGVFSINIPLTAGSKYSIYLSNGAYWVYNIANTYSGGIASFNSGYDFAFRTYLASPQQDVFVVTNDGDVSVLGKVKTNEFQLPIGAGANKILSSDVAGNASWQSPSTIYSNWTVSGNNIYNNNIGNVGIGKTNPIGSLDVESTSNTPLYVRGTNSQVRIIENDYANKQWTAGVNNGNFSITEDAVAIPFIIKAGSDANVLITTNDTVQIKKLQVGSNGTAIAKMQAGTFAVGSQPLVQATKEVTFTFSTAFTSTPKIIATCRNELSTYVDQYVATVKTLSATSVTFIVRRLDSNIGWGQNVQLDWWGFE
jgi:subtilisin-like proprotein convertase family protein